MGPGAQHSRCHDRPDAELLEQVRAPAADDGHELLLQLPCLFQHRVRATSQGPQCHHSAGRVSVSHEACTRRFAAVLSIAASFWPRNLTRIGSGAAMTRLKTCCWAWRGGVDRGASSSQQHRQGLAFATGAGSSEPRSSHRFPGGADRVERVGLCAVASRSPLRAVQLDDDLGHLKQVTAQTGAVAAGSLDRPSPQCRVVVGELDQLAVALGCSFDGDLVEDTTGRVVDYGRGACVDVGVDADDDIDHLA